jgi:YgiT-type zinc finger domain-containing protein
MWTCAACGCSESRDELVSEIFRVSGEYVLVDCIPATVCSRCGEQSFSRETTERVRKIVHEPTQPTRSITINVFEFV